MLSDYVFFKTLALFFVTLRDIENSMNSQLIETGVLEDKPLDNNWNSQGTSCIALFLPGRSWSLSFVIGASWRKRLQEVLKHLFELAKDSISS